MSLMCLVFHLSPSSFRRVWIILWAVGLVLSRSAGMVWYWQREMYFFL